MRASTRPGSRLNQLAQWLCHAAHQKSAHPQSPCADTSTGIPHLPIHAETDFWRGFAPVVGLPPKPFSRSIIRDPPKPASYGRQQPTKPHPPTHEIQTHSLNSRSTHSLELFQQFKPRHNPREEKRSASTRRRPASFLRGLRWARIHHNPSKRENRSSAPQRRRTD